MKPARALVAALALTLAGGTAAAQGSPSKAESQDAHHPASSSRPAAGTPKMDLMQKMQGQMQRIRETKDPAERRKLMDEHQKSMQEGMNMMHGMMGGGKPAAGGMKPEARMGMMEQRMDMMQMMMEQMMQREAVAAPAAK